MHFFKSAILVLVTCAAASLALPEVKDDCASEGESCASLSCCHEMACLGISPICYDSPSK
ncbi:hypothetical protein PILCRDRAFT_817966 [Piloderma croceum F 1598]|uniref:Uncharacterized protein n=1 Tax=Piloderma croceum (strain F 1598) TaxID=765440 RepID=A0A0C3BFT1_PILCF|nr:hypothetical protein PILCRDRAFT_817966 [Piloderma croceum F 1598]